MIESKYQNEDEAIQAILDKLRDREPTLDNILNASASCMREDVYHQFPTAKPEVVEALLLMFRFFCEQTFGEIESVT